MNFEIDIFLSALGLAFILESLPWIVSPRRMRNFLLSLATRPQNELRFMGFLGMSVGLFIVWLVRS